jgi:hypothetical protein
MHHVRILSSFVRAPFNTVESARDVRSLAPLAHSELLAATAAATLDDVTAAVGLHALAEAMGATTLDTRWLVSALGHDQSPILFEFSKNFYLCGACPKIRAAPSALYAPPGRP